MLILRRKPGESVRIGERIEVQVVEIAGGRVKLGISAPEEVLILRTEIHQAAEHNRTAALGVTPEAIQWVTPRFRSRS